LYLTILAQCNNMALALLLHGISTCISCVSKRMSTYFDIIL
jgi:hypothetical protein